MKTMNLLYTNLLLLTVFSSAFGMKRFEILLAFNLDRSFTEVSNIFAQEATYLDYYSTTAPENIEECKGICQSDSKKRLRIPEQNLSYHWINFAQKYSLPATLLHDQVLDVDSITTLNTKFIKTGSLYFEADYLKNCKDFVFREPEYHYILGLFIDNKSLNYDQKYEYGKRLAALGDDNSEGGNSLCTAAIRAFGQKIMKENKMVSVFRRRKKDPEPAHGIAIHTFFNLLPVRLATGAGLAVVIAGFLHYYSRHQ